jgi:hypothetical protein
MTALVRYNELEQTRARSWVELMAPAVELAKQIAGTDFVPRPLRMNVPAITAAILYGDEVGLGPLQSLSKIAVIDGKPYIAAEAQRGLVYAAGHQLWIEEATNTRVTWCGKRANSDAVTKISWTMDDARRAKLDQKPNWRNYPRAMLSARASAELVRAVFADVIGGLAAIEEYDDTFNTDLAGGPTPAGGTAADRDNTTTARRRARRPAAPAVASTPEPARSPPGTGVGRPPLPGEPDDGVSSGIDTDSDQPVLTSGPPQPVEPPEPIRGEQRRRMMALFRRRNIQDRKVRLQLASEWVGRPLTTSAELTAQEADRVLDVLESLPPTDQPISDGQPPADDVDIQGEIL